MKKKYLYGIAIGLMVIILSKFLGQLSGVIYLKLNSGMDTERCAKLIQETITSFQITGGIVVLISGIQYFLKRGH